MLKTDHPFRTIESPRWRKRALLDPVDRLSEALFGLVMVLTATCTFSVAEGGRVEARVMFISALGSSVAWGIVDGIIYLVGRLIEQGQAFRAIHAVRRSRTPEEANRILSGELPAAIAAVVKPAEWEEMRHRLIEQPEPPERPRLAGEDWLGAAAVVVLVCLATVPVAIPFLLFDNPAIALRVSNATAVTMLFLMGVRLGKDLGYPGLRLGFGMVLLGVLLVAVTVALGG